MINNAVAIDGSKVSIKLDLTINNDLYKFNVKRKPEELDYFLNEEMKDPYTLMCEEFLIKRDFYKTEEGYWQDKKKYYYNIALPNCFFNNGKLRIKFGQVYSTLDFSSGTLTSLEGLPTKVNFEKDNQNKLIKGDIVLYNHINGQKNCVIDIPYKDVNRYLFKAVVLPYYEEYKKKIDRWLNKEFDYLGINNVEIGFFNWLIREHEYTKLQIFERFFIDLKKYIDDNNISKIKNKKWPEGFFDWVQSERDEKIGNFIKSIFVVDKFRL